MTLSLLASGLFCIGLFGVLTRRDLVAILASIEIMLAAGLVQLVAHMNGSAASSASGRALGESMGVILLALFAAEAAVGLALVIAAKRRTGRTRIDEFEELNG